MPEHNTDSPIIPIVDIYRHTKYGKVYVIEYRGPGWDDSTPDETTLVASSLVNARRAAEHLADSFDFDAVHFRAGDHPAIETLHGVDRYSCPEED